MKKFLSIAAICVISVSAYTLNVEPGWQLEGALEDINITSFNKENIISVWAWDKKQKVWKAYLPNKEINLSKYGVESLNKIQKGEGYWINSNGYLTLNIGTIENNQNINENNEAVNETNESYGEDENNDIDFSHISKYLIDKPINFKLSDVAGKTFKVIFEGEGTKEFTFDNNGNATFSMYNNVYNLKFEDGLIKTYENGKLEIEFKKIKSDDNGIIALGTKYEEDYNGVNDVISYEFLDGWSTNFTPINMATLNYPKTLYNPWGDKWIIENNGIIKFPWGEEDNYTIENGAIVTEHNWSDDLNISGNYVKYTFQIVNQIDRYYVVKETYNGYDWIVLNDLKGKTLDDIIDSNISIDGMYFHSDGSVSFDYNATLNENVTYTKISSNEINVTNCFVFNDEDNKSKCVSDLIKLDPSTGKIIRIYPESQWQEIFSETPIINKPEDNRNYRKRVINIKSYIKFQLKRALKKVF
jgi:hypothetical protein